MPNNLTPDVLDEGERLLAEFESNLEAERYHAPSADANAELACSRRRYSEMVLRHFIVENAPALLAAARRDLEREQAGTIGRDR